MDPSPSTSIATYFADAGLILFALFLVLLNGFFVAAEFAMVKLRATRVETIAKQHGWRGAILRKVHNQLDAYLSACQLGITLASLGLGWVGEPAFAELLEPLLAMIGVHSDELIRGISFFTAFFIISYLHIVVGEPGAQVLGDPQTGTAVAVDGGAAVPFLLADVPGDLAAQRQRQRHPQDRRPGRARPAPRASLQPRRTEADPPLQPRPGPQRPGHARAGLGGGLGELEVVDWANSREDLVYLEHDAPLADILAVIRRHKYSRYPVWDSHKGEFIGLLHIKDLLLALSALDSLPETFDLDELVRPLEIVTKHTPLSRLLEQFRKGGAHFAVVEEADHKVVGFLTMEDVLEVLVGDIQDEHRKTERGILAYQPGKLLVRGDTPLFKLERLLGIDLDHVEADTLAGLVYDTLKRVPEEEEVLDTEGLRIIVKKMRGPKIVLAKVVKLD